MDRVPAILVNAPTSIQGLLEGRLADITPTLLDIMGLAKPDDVSGKSLLIHWEDTSADRLETSGRALA